MSQLFITKRYLSVLTAYKQANQNCPYTVQNRKSENVNNDLAFQTLKSKQYFAHNLLVKKKSDSYVFHEYISRYMVLKVQRKIQTSTSW